MAEQMKMKDAAENTLARFVVQLITPVLLGLIAFLGQRQLSAIEQKQADESARSAKQAEQLSSVASDVRDLNTRFDLIAVRRLEELDKRVERLERATKAP